MFYDSDSDEDEDDIIPDRVSDLNKNSMYNFIMYAIRI